MNVVAEGLVNTERLKVVEVTLLHPAGCDGDLLLQRRRKSKEHLRGSQYGYLWWVTDYPYQGATVRAYDPVASAEALKVMPELDCAERVQDVLDGADAVVLVTEWPELVALDWTAAAKLMAGNVVIDGRNALDAAAVRGAGLLYEGIGVT